LLKKSVLLNLAEGKKMKKVAITAMLASALMTSQVSAENLLDVFNMSLQSDPQLLAEAASRQAVNELDDQALANFLPQIGLSANTLKNWSDGSAGQRQNQFRIGDMEYNSHGYNLSLTQSIYRRENFVQRDQAEIAIDTADASFFAAEQELIVRVSERYFGVLGAEDDLTFAKAELESIAKQLEQMQQRFDVGMATITDVTEAQAAYDLANASVIAAENALSDAHEQLRETAGTYLYDLASLEADSPLLAPEPTDIDAWSSTALAQNPSLLVASKNVDAAKETIELQRSGHYPTLDVVAQKS
jgi:outer membrane protein